VGRSDRALTGTARSADGIPIEFDADGDGSPALVFVHGWSCDRTYWRSQMPFFADRFRVVAVDLAGHGRSGTGRHSWTMSAFGDDVAAVVERLGLDETVLIGHSMGGDVIVEAALRLDDRVKGLVWLDTYRTLGDPSYRDGDEAFVESFRQDFVRATHAFVRRVFPAGADPALVDWVADDMSAAGSDDALDALEHAINNEDAVVAALPRLTAPVVSISPADRPTDIEALGRHGVEAILLSGVGHFMMLEDPDALNPLLGGIINGFLPDQTD
jgi:pimeloyl-ACP methyl ester carboxylesterase